MKCVVCCEDIDLKGQDNVSPISGYPICEDCIDKVENIKPSKPCKNCIKAEWMNDVDVLEFACDMTHCIMAESDYD